MVRVGEGKIWRARRHLKKAWGALRKDESLASGELGLFASYHLGPKGPLYEMAGQTKRAGDFICFLTELQKNYYDNRERANPCARIQGVTITTAWRFGRRGGRSGKHLLRHGLRHD